MILRLYIEEIKVDRNGRSEIFDFILDMWSGNIDLTFELETFEALTAFPGIF